MLHRLDSVRGTIQVATYTKETLDTALATELELR